MLLKVFPAKGYIAAKIWTIRGQLMHPNIHVVFDVLPKPLLFVPMWQLLGKKVWRRTACLVFTPVLMAREQEQLAWLEGLVEARM